MWTRRKNTGQLDGAAALSDGDRIIVAQGASPEAKRSTISSFITRLLTLLGTMATQNANNVAITGGSITGAAVHNLPTPSASGDATTKAYVDALALNVASRGAVRVASTANVTVSTGLANGQTVDGKTLVTGDLVLLKDQSTASQNGVYVVPASGTASRAPQFDTWSEIPGSLVVVEEGTANADTLWICTADQGGTLGSTSIPFTRIRIDISIPVSTAQGGLGANNSASSGLPIFATGVVSFQSLGTGVATALGVNTGTAGAFVVRGSTLGTPSSGDASNLINYPVANIANLGSGVATFLATPSSANLRAALTDETGTGAAVFATSPAITTPTINGGTAPGLGGVAPWSGGYTAGRYYCGIQAGGGATSPLSANVAYFFPIVVGETHTFDRIALEVTTAGTAANMRMGIYGTTNGSPGTRVLDAGAVAISSTGIKSVTISQSLAPGVYFLVVVLDGTATVSAIGNAQLGTMWFGGTTSLSAPDTQLTATLTFGAFPTTAFSGGMGAVTYAGAPSPILLLRA